MTVTPELSAKITYWRHSLAEGTITQEEMKEAIRALREGRLAAGQATSAAKRKKAIIAIPHADDLLGEIDSI